MVDVTPIMAFVRPRQTSVEFWPVVSDAEFLYCRSAEKLVHLIWSVGHLRGKVKIAQGIRAVCVFRVAQQDAVLHASRTNFRYRVVSERRAVRSRDQIARPLPSRTRETLNVRDRWNSRIQT